MSSTNKLRGKIHSGVATGTQMTPMLTSGSPDLTIEIPKLSTSQARFTQLHPKVKANTGNIPPKFDTIPQIDKAAGDGAFPAYRDGLLDKLGPDYEGVEKYRLEQDEARERHWKRWGPYLSERQWVSSILLHTFIS
jgi:hypothetical protein